MDGQEKERALRLLSYHAWANAQVVAALGNLTADALDAPTHEGFGSLRVVLTHIAAVDELWLSRLTGHSPTAMPQLGGNGLMDLKRCLTESAAGLRAAVTRAPEVVSYATLNGAPQETPALDIVTHVVNHGTYHRGQIAALLRQSGLTPLPTDFIVWQRMQPAGQDFDHLA